MGKKVETNKTKKIGRPRLDIDADLVERLAERFCTYSEIAAIISCDESTIRKRFPEIVAKGREKGKKILRGWQLKAAENGNATMLIWLGKQYLEQTDEIKVKHESKLEVQSLEDLVRNVFGVSYKASASVSAGVAQESVSIEDRN